MVSITLGSLFDGSGGFPLGGLLAGITPVWASEIEPFPIRVTTKRMPFMKHYGNVSEMDGGKVEPVDIITFGSPCQDMSVAGKRAGLDGSRSNLFYEAVRIVKEMRCTTNGKYPRYIVWENVPGAFSSNKGQDFRSVLEAVCSVKDADPVIPEPPKGRWDYAGSIVGDGYSVAWRTLDAQFWGVPQRRRRIYLVADFNGGSAGKILFESEGLSGYSAEGFRSWQGAAGCPTDSLGEAVSHVAVENHPADSRVKIEEDGNVQTLSSRMGTGGNNVPLVMEIRSGCEGGGKGPLIQTDKSATLSCNNDQTLFEPCSWDGGQISPTLTKQNAGGGQRMPDKNHFNCVLQAYGISAKDSNAMKSANPHSGIYEADTSRTLDGNGGNPACNQGGIAIVEGNGTRPSHQGAGFSEEVQPTLVAKGPGAAAKAEPEYTVRRLTPTECARLQGFPDWWCNDLGTDEPTEEDIAFWREVFETHRTVTGSASKPKTDAQIVKWLKDPYSDSAEYKMWGNGVALPCVCFVLAGIVYYNTKMDGEEDGCDET